VGQEPALKGRVGESQSDSGLLGQGPGIDHLLALAGCLNVKHAPNLIEILPAVGGLLLLRDGLFDNREAGTSFAWLDHDSEVLPDCLLVKEAPEVIGLGFPALADDQDAGLLRAMRRPTVRSFLSPPLLAATVPSAARHFSSISSNAGPKTGTPPYRPAR
jgi:hypothetical protein